jgi:hypothetical protein
MNASWRSWSFLVLSGAGLASGCGASSDAGTTADVGVPTGGGAGGDGAGGAGNSPSGGGAPEADGGVVDPGPLPSLRTVPGDLTYTERVRPGDATTAHVYSILADGTLRQRLTPREGAWTEHAVGPDKRHVALVRRVDDQGNDAAEGRGEVWVLDVRTREQWPITPETCDAGLGGVGWRDDVQLVFAMRCDGADAQLYLASKEIRSREVSDLLRLTDFEGGATDAFTAVRTGIVAYVRPCTEADCGDATEVWVSELDLELSCRLTRSSGGVDRHPAFNVDLSAVTYARDGRTHRIGLNVRALYGGEAECGLPGTDVVLGDDLWEATEGAVEDYPQMATAGGLLAGSVLFVERAADGRGRVRLSDRMGTLVDLTPPTVDASYARWVVDAFDTSGER